MTDEYFFTCPYCWQQISFILDASVPEQAYIEDCEVCCNPIEVEVKADELGVLSLAGATSAPPLWLLAGWGGDSGGEPNSQIPPH